MCNFFSFVTKGSQKFYFNWKQRQELLENNPEDYEPDSHTSICHYHKLDDDRVNKYEYNPLTKKFNVDQINIKDDQALAKKWVEKLDFKSIIEPLVIKPIINPLTIQSPEWSDKHLQLLKQWASVGASVGASVRASVWASVRASVRDSIRDSVRDSIRDSIRASVSSYIFIEKWKYIDHEKGINPFQSCIDLWELGFVPSFDGEIWRIHSGEKAEIVFEITKKEIINK